MGGGSKKTTVGYKYYLGLHAVFSHGPVDALTHIYFDKKLAWAGYITAGGQLGISNKNLFGGEDIGAEGGVAGVVDWCPGEPTQGLNSYLQSKLGSNDIPAFRGVTGLVFNDFYFGTTKYIKPVSARMTRIRKTTGGAEQWYVDKSQILTYEGEPRILLASQELTPTFNDISDSANDYEHTNFMNLGTFHESYLEIVAGNSSGGGNAVRIDTVFVANDIGYRHGDYNDYPNYPNFCTPGDVLWRGPCSGSLIITVFDKNLQADGVTWGYGSGSVGMQGTIHVRARDAFFDMNPAHIIRECLVDPTWGMGYQEADIDDTSFEAAADTLFDEGFGLSLLWDRQMQIDQFIGEIIKHIDGALYVDRKTGLFTLKLIRGDYDVETLPLLDESNIDKIEGFSRPTFGELVNSVSVNFWDAQANQDSSMTLTDPALIQMQGATINTTLQYPGITNRTLAARIAMRDLTTLSNPLVSCTIYANSVAEDFAIGSVFLFSWEEYGIVEMPMRVTAIAYGDGVKNAVKMTCTQDVFKLPQTSTFVPPDVGWEDPNQPAAPVTIQYAEEMTYFELVQRQGQSDVDARIATDPNIGLTAFACSRPQSGAINALVYIDAGSGYEQVISSADFAPSGLLDANIGRLDTTFTLKSLTDESLIEVGTYATFVVGGVSGEKVYIEDYDDVTNEVTVRRGCLDTTPEEYAEDTLLIFDDVYQSSDNIEYIQSDEVDVKLLTSTGSSVVDIADATAMTIDFDSRAARPYPPANVKLQDAYWPEGVLTGDLEFTFVTRNRKLQTGADLLGFTDSTVTPEENCVVCVEIYDASDDSLLYSEDDITSPFDATPHSTALQHRAEFFSKNTVTLLESRNRVKVPYLYGFEIEAEIVGVAKGESYSCTLGVTGGTAPFTWTLVSGSLPDGLMLNSETGEISGVVSNAAANGDYTFTLRATDAIGTYVESAFTMGVGTYIALLHMNGTNGGTTFTDETGRSWTRSGNAQTSTDGAALGGTSGLFDGSGDYLTTADHADFTLGTSDFTIEAFVTLAANVPGGAFPGIIGQRSSVSSQHSFTLYLAPPTNTNQARFVYNNGGAELASNLAQALVATTRTHVAITRRGTKLFFHIAGVPAGASTIGATSIIDSNQSVRIAAFDSGPFSGSYFNGRLNEFRFLKSGARYNETETFTPATAIVLSDYGKVAYRAFRLMEETDNSVSEDRENLILED